MNNFQDNIFLIIFVMQEYNALRSEMKQSIANRNLVALFGFLSLTIMSYIGVYSIINGFQDISFMVFSVFLPAIGIIILSIWLGEAERVTRLGIYLYKLEARINLLLHKSKTNKLILNWENWLRGDSNTSQQQSNNQFLYPYYAIVLLFLAIPSLLSFLSITYIDLEVEYKITVSILNFFMYVIYTRWFVNRAKNLELRYKK
ncbi:hypothetical protein [Geitlerinema sp. PCC 9228]|jgi:hypothetical protein|uniref:hypothetical protein n=1 Tax=Geitlerinema sp. PCC 9228 TaxID=111611 RepID=UPI001114E411|nr:hypothetical protein [Geitlerinema sp. PCC 9228]